jgi:hypothetical protein
LAVKPCLRQNKSLGGGVQQTGNINYPHISWSQRHLHLLSRAKRRIRSNL